MKKSTYSRNISLQCVTCGADYAFESNDSKGIIKCLRCNRIYYLNQNRIDEEMQFLVKEVEGDLEKEIVNMFKKAGFKIK